MLLLYNKFGDVRVAVLLYQAGLKAVRSAPPLFGREMQLNIRMIRSYSL